MYFFCSLVLTIIIWIAIANACPVVLFISQAAMGVLTVDSLLASYIANVVRDHYSSFYNSYLHMAAVAVIMVYDYISVYSDLRKV